MDINLDYIVAQLQRRRDQRQLAKVARAVRVTTRTLANIMSGRPGTTAIATRLQDYLRRTEHQKELEDGGQ